MQDIRKQFSLDWLSDKGSERAPSSGEVDKVTPGAAADPAQAALDEAVLFYARPILKQLEQAPSGRLGLHDLALTMNQEVKDFQFDEMWEVVKQLVGRSMIEVTDTSDPTGNYQIQLAPRASVR